MKTKITLLDGTTKDITVIHADKVRGEMEAHRQGLPSLQDAPVTGVTVHVWAACKRMYPEATPHDFNAWLDTIEDLELDDAIAEADAVNPPQPAAR